ncbi:tRNA (adenosine(37)-N6)-threonylcarbamoyltransferase complex dimerization subunit type 1 TsaB [Actinomycetaceae bacterium WB03_NA08]|uniref:tRNA (Adenosine(37)-N6)-threonylcarbamoyltransferase complex dimerization subunit type 1 TsaB n=1 Tax=Scrofimicrobium canadense TaxID=2652290 RepID=A0A6N7VPW4_9ACTO|nr:tRNA (adenosine(37)-N6)-threonylcarbamoyltransferase complex dimerization subunit type 1 TsaB [Scrofimicrobium canadense]MSS83767.1 tRNA (adenosine(37)-N6)-threonylcarbamoyltransferase complex dimerization subunit type 1 TsaB [Scrofimicrobium canadense]
MIDLCIDTSAGSSVAVMRDGEVVARGYEDNPRMHAEALTPLIEQARSEAGVAPGSWDRVLVGTGPAPFTGLRAGLITAKVIAKASGAQLHGIPSLAVLAKAHLGNEVGEVVTAMSDARRGEVYWAVYRNGEEGLEEVRPPYVGKTAEEQGRVVGPGVPVDVTVMPALVEEYLARGEDTPVQPLYLRRPDIHGA